MRQSQRNNLLERTAQIADERQQASWDAAERYEARGEPEKAATEHCASYEARHIGERIRAMKRGGDAG